MSDSNNQRRSPSRPSPPWIWDLVIEDMRSRDNIGAVRYGTRLHADNGRDALRDAYEEALDQTVYMRQALWAKILRRRWDVEWDDSIVVGELLLVTVEHESFAEVLPGRRIPRRPAEFQQNLVKKPTVSEQKVRARAAAV